MNIGNNRIATIDRPHQGDSPDFQLLTGRDQKLTFPLGGSHQNSAMRPLRVAIIGAGKQGQEHLFAVEQLVAKGEMTLAGLCDLNAQMAQLQGERLRTSWYTDYRQLVWEQRPELVILSVPNNAYDEIIRFCIAEGVNILKEKPLAFTYEQGNAYLQLARENNLLFVTSQQRFYTRFAGVRHWLERLGDLLLYDYEFSLRSGDGNQSRWYWEREAGGGCWYGLGWHACFLMAWYLGLPDQMRVRTFSSNRRNWSYQTDDTAVFEASYQGGPLARGFVSVVGIEKRERLLIQGTKGTITVDRECAVLYDSKGTMVNLLDHAVRNPYVRQLEEIAETIRQRGRNQNDRLPTYIIGDDLTAQTMLMISRGLESAGNGGQPVSLPRNESL
jgi:predicted dehydrogenase